jgi:pseudaminic acid cytidylyltransferase
MSSTLAIIPARGGSKRIPRKNIRLLRGRPALAWTIDTARRSGLFDEIMVSTEDEEIAAIAREAGATVPFMRSPRTAGDHASTVEVLVEVLANYAAQGAKPFDLVCSLYPTAVLLEPEHLLAGFRLLEENPDLDSAMAVQVYRHPIERAYRLTDGVVRPIDPRKSAVRTQDLPIALHDAGQFDWFRPARLAATGNLLGERCAPVMLEPWQVVDLDTESDWKFLERLMTSRDGVTMEGGVR